LHVELKSYILEVELGPYTNRDMGDSADGLNTILISTVS